jgi:hypothetical protein
MKHRLLIVLLTIFIGFFALIACTKQSGIDEQMSGPFIDLVKRFPPDPMEPDSLELDTLESPQFK